MTGDPLQSTMLTRQRKVSDIQSGPIEQRSSLPSERQSKKAKKIKVKKRITGIDEILANSKGSNPDKTPVEKSGEP